MSIADIPTKIGEDTEINTDEPRTPANIAKLKKANTEEVKISPYGFGPYPEVPEGFEENVITPIWIYLDRYFKGRTPSPDVINIQKQELMDRVLIKLWQDDPDSRKYMEGVFIGTARFMSSIVIVHTSGIRRLNFPMGQQPV